jgi:hypothetical protein
MPDHEPPISLGLNLTREEAPTSLANLARPEELQFEHAIPLYVASGTTQLCAACKTPLTGQYFQAQGLPVCPHCADRINSRQQAPPPISLLPAVLYGSAAAFAGFLIYATVAIAFDLQLALISILVGVMVGKAVRKGSKGLGGRPQQILAVALTYFAITTSYIPVFIHEAMKTPAKTAQASAAPSSNITEPNTAKPSLGSALLIVLLIALAAPFMGLASGFSGILNIAIIFFGLQNAWKLTGRTDLIITGPYGP